jgi:hypothetical protein
LAALGESGGSDRATALASGYSYLDAFLGDISCGENSLGDVLRLELFVVYKIIGKFGQLESWRAPLQIRAGVYKH